MVSTYFLEHFVQDSQEYSFNLSSAFFVGGNTLKGFAHDKLNEHDEAIKAYDKAIEINPQDSDAWYNKGVALDKLDKSDEAIKAYDKAIEINPQNSDAWYNKGIALDDLNKSMKQ